MFGKAEVLEEQTGFEGASQGIEETTEVLVEEEAETPEESIACSALSPGIEAQAEQRVARNKDAYDWYALLDDDCQSAEHATNQNPTVKPNLGVEVLHYSVKKTIGYVILSFLAVWGGVELMLAGPADISGNSTGSLLGLTGTHILGMFCILLFGLGGFCFLKFIPLSIKSMPAFIFDEDGFTTHSMMVGGAYFVPWSEIREIRKQDGAQNIVVEWMGGTIFLNSFFLPISLDELHHTVRKHHFQATANNTALSEGYDTSIRGVAKLRKSTKRLQALYLVICLVVLSALVSWLSYINGDIDKLLKSWL